MGRFTFKQILGMEDPYKELIDQNEEGLAEHAEELNQLSQEEMRQVATKLVLNCPDENIRALGKQKEALRSHITSTVPSFYSVLSQAYTVRMNVYALLDERNKKPYQIFTREFNADLYNQFPELFNSLLKGHESEIGQRLAQNESSLSEIAKKLEQLSQNAVDKDAPVKLLAKAFNEEAEATHQKFQSTAREGRERFGTFSPVTSSPTPPLRENNEEETKQSRCFPSCTIL
ncbi:hypothetical protein E3983_13185 [Legionella israelensis]|uniref:Uncharacterized protein n=1 Tax=Legionella israelensis TaxID=454 RepID=A0AAX1EJH1_9GAMM|nr:hypothetical protein [Legionella israelensis]QBR85217.1 hypothetical protein E3983_13185 [Legionella israelensis]